VPHPTTAEEGGFKFSFFIDLVVAEDDSGEMDGELSWS